MEENYLDITEFGTQGLRGLPSLVSNQNQRTDITGEDTTNKERSIADIILQSEHPYQQLGSYFSPTQKTEDIGLEAMSLGYGDSRFDKNATQESDLYNLDEIRAQNQTGIEQLAHGVAKGIGLAATTFVDNFAGTAAGLANVIGKASQGEISKDQWFTQGLNAFVDNPVSRELQEINDKMEVWLPNYYTEAEKNNSWWQNAFTANFIGDHFLKNTGFMVGALFSGIATSGILSKAMKLEQSRNIFKGMASAAGMNDKNAIQVAAQMARNGATGAVVEKALANSAKELVRKEIALKAIAGLSASWGESRIEALGGSDEFFNRNKPLLDQFRQQQLDNIDNELLQERPDLFVKPVFDYNGQVIGYERLPYQENEEYKQLYNQKIDSITGQYNAALEELNNRRIDFANNSFLVNFGLTYLENLTIFGNAITGGYTTAKRAKNLVDKVTINQAAKEGALGQFKYAASKEAINTLKAKNIAKGIWSPIFEGTQEMLQRVEQVTEDIYQGTKFNTFMGQAIDPNGLDSNLSWTKAFSEALGKVYSDPEEWENFALGFVTALLPMGGYTTVTNEKGEIQYDELGRQKTKRTLLGGEFWDNVYTANKGLNAQAESQANALNQILDNPDKRNLVYSLVMRDTFSQRKDAALENNDVLAFKNAEFDELISEAIRFQESGRGQDYRDLINTYMTIETSEQVEDLKKNTVLTDGDTQVSLYDGMSDEQIIQKFANQKKQALEVIDKAQTISDQFDQLYGTETLAIAKPEYIASVLRIDDRENRIKQLSNEILDYVNGLTSSYKQEDKNELLDNLRNIQDFTAVMTNKEALKVVVDAIDKNENAKKTLDNFIENKYAAVNSERGLLQVRINRLTRKRDEQGLNKTEQKQLDALTKRKEKLDKSTAGIKDKLEKLRKTVQDLGGETELNRATFVQKINDLSTLISDREALVSLFGVFSNVDTRPVLEKALSNDIDKALEFYINRRVDKVYSKVKKSRDLSNLDETLPLGYIRDKAVQNGDQELVDYIDVREDYLNILRSNAKKFNESDLVEVFESIDDELGRKENGQFANNTKATMKAGIEGFLQRRLFELNIEKDNSTSTPIKIKLDQQIQIIESILEAKENSKKAEKGFKKNIDQEGEEEIDESNTDEEEEENIEGYPLTDKNREFAKKSHSSVENEMDKITTLDEVDQYVDSYGIRAEINEMLDIAEDTEALTDALEPDASTLEAVKDNILDLHTQLSRQLKEEGRENSRRGKTSNEDEDELKSSSQAGESAFESLNDEEEDDEDSSSENGGIDNYEDEDDDSDSDESSTANMGFRSKVVGKTSKTSREVSESPVITTATKIVNPQKEHRTITNSEGSNVEIVNRGKEDAWAVGRRGTKWDWRELKKSRRKAELREDTWDDFIWKGKGREFIENGDLNRLQEYWSEHHNGSKLPIRFVKVKHAGNFEGEGAEKFKRMNATYANTLFAAVEIPKGFTPSIAIETAQVTPEVGNDLSLLILGEISYCQGSKSQNASYWRALNDQINVSYNRMRKIKKEVGYELRMFTPSITTNLEYIFSGRMVKEIEAVDGEKAVNYGIHNLGDILTTEEQKQLKNNSEYTPFEIVVKAGSQELVFGNIEAKNKSSRKVELNTFSGEHRREMGSPKTNNVGTVWLRVMEADGKIYYKGVKINRFDENTDDNSPVAKKIRQIIQDLVENKDATKEDWKIYLGRLSRFLYTSAAKSNKMFLHLEGDRFFQIGTDEGPARKIYLDEEDAEERIYQAIKHEGYRFNLVADNSSTNTVENLSLQDIVASNMISTDLARIHNVGASFLVSQLIVKEGEIPQVVDSKVAQELRTGQLIHTGRKDVYASKVASMPIQLDYSNMKGKYYKAILDDNKKFHFYEVASENAPINEDNEITDPLKVKLLTTKLQLDYQMKEEQRTLEDLIRSRGISNIEGLRYTWKKQGKKLLYTHIYIPISVANMTLPIYMDEKGRIIYSEKYPDEYRAISNLGKGGQIAGKANEFLNKAGRNANLVLKSYQENPEDKTIIVTVINSEKQAKAKEGDFSYLYIGRDDIIASQKDFNYSDSDTQFKVDKLVFELNAKTGEYEVSANVYLSDGTETRKDGEGKPIKKNMKLKLNGPSNLSNIIKYKEKWNPSLVGNPIQEIVSVPLDQLPKKTTSKKEKQKESSSKENVVLTIPKTRSSRKGDLNGEYTVVQNEDNSLTITYNGDTEAKAIIAGNLVPDFTGKVKAFGINQITISPDGTIQIQSDLSSKYNQPELEDQNVLQQVIEQELPELSKYLKENTKQPVVKVSLQNLGKKMDEEKPVSTTQPTQGAKRRPTVKSSTIKKQDNTANTMDQLVGRLYQKLKGRYGMLNSDGSEGPSKSYTLKEVLNNLQPSTLEELDRASVDDAEKIFRDNKYCWYPF